MSSIGKVVGLAVPTLLNSEGKEIPANPQIVTAEAVGTGSAKGIIGQEPPLVTVIQVNQFAPEEFFARMRILQFHQVEMLNPNFATTKTVSEADKPPLGFSWYREANGLPVLWKRNEDSSD